jgi:uncharacterized protein involved in outer membrane biogenesis
MKRIAIVVVAIVAVIAAAVGALAVFPPKELVKSRFAQQIKDATGRELSIKGATSVRLLPSFVLRTEDVELKGQGDPLFTARAVQIETGLWPLLMGSSVFDQVRLEAPRIALATDSKGQPNWAMPPGGGPAVVVRALTITGGTLSYRDGTSHEALAVTGIEGSAKDFAGANIAQLALKASEANVRVAAAGPQLTFASVDAEAKAIASGSAAEVTLKAASLLLRQSGGAEPVKLEAPQVTAKSASPAGALDAAIALVLNGDRITSDVRLQSPAAVAEGKPSPVTIKLAGPKGTLDLDGTLITTGGTAKLDGKATAASPSLRSLATWAGIQLPKTGAFGAVRAEGNVKLDGARVALEGAQIALDATKATGSLTVDLGAARPMISGQLSADALDVDSYLVPAPKPAPAKKARTRDLTAAATPAAPPAGSEKETLKNVLRVQLEALDAPQQAGPEAAPADDPGQERTRALAVSSAWSDDPFDLSGLKAFDADLSLSFVKVTVAGVEIAVPDLKAALKEGTLALDIKNIAVEGAKITGTASVNAREALPKLSAKLKAQGVDPQAWFELFGQETRFIGKSTVEADLSGIGNSQRKLVDTLTGRIKAATSKGAILGYDLNSFWGLLTALTGQYNADWRTPFDELEAELALTNGISRKSNVEVTGSVIGVNGNGVLRLPSQEIDYRARLTLLSWGQAAAVHILGGWTQPKVNYSLAPSGTARALVQQDPLEPFKAADLKDPELADLASQVLKKGADKGALSPQMTEALQALKARAEGGK